MTDRARRSAGRTLVAAGATVAAVAAALALAGGPAGASLPITASYVCENAAFVVPTGVHDVDVAVYGARGGAGEGNGSDPGTFAAGGAGGGATGTLAVTPGSTISVVAGCQGEVSTDTNVGGPGGAGDGSGGPGGDAGNPGGGGGGGSSVTSGGLLRLLTGGGGGGAADADDTTKGGNGGGPNQAGVDGVGGACSGKGATVAAGGAGGTGTAGNGTAGSAGGGGGAAADTTPGSTSSGGGGGGGFRGGGGAGVSVVNSGCGGGGGGSGYADGTVQNLAGDSGVNAGDGLVEITYTPPTFTDVGTNNPFFDDIEWMFDQGISNGFGDGTYRPLAPVSRGAMSAFMYRLAGSPVFTPPSPPTFSDVSATHPFFPEIEWMSFEAITTGYGDNTYRPGANVSRGAMSAFMYRLAGSPGFWTPTPPTFSDVSATHPFFLEIEWMSFEAITTGFVDNTYRPAANVSRQAMSAFLHRLSDGPGVGV